MFARTRRPATRRPAAPRPAYEVLELRSAWRIKDGHYYREALARRAADGELVLVLVPDGRVRTAAAAA